MTAIAIRPTSDKPPTSETRRLIQRWESDANFGLSDECDDMRRNPDLSGQELRSVESACSQKRPSARRFVNGWTGFRERRLKHRRCAIYSKKRWSAIATTDPPASGGGISVECRASRSTGIANRWFSVVQVTRSRTRAKPSPATTDRCDVSLAMSIRHSQEFPCRLRRGDSSGADRPASQQLAGAGSADA